MNAFQSFFADLGVFGGLLLGAPLALIGLAMRGLARRHEARMLVAAQTRRRIADVMEPGPVALIGPVSRLSEGRLLVEDPRTQARVVVEHDDELRLRAGQTLLVYGNARLETGAREGGATSAYRGDARRFIVDARGEEHFVVPCRREPSAQLSALRAQAFSGAVVFAAGVLLASASSAVALSLSF